MNFIGQKRLIEALKTANSKSILIQGPKHFGKKTLMRQFYTDTGSNTYEITGDAADFREALDFMKVQANPITYLIPDVDDCNITIQNMLLKILEEPPPRATFCITASNFILPTIKSRCVTYLMEPYTTEQLKLATQDTRLLEYADSPGRCALIQSAVDFNNPDDQRSLINLMLYIRNNLRGNLALLMVKVDDIGKVIREKSIPYFTFYLLARKIYEGYDCLQVLTSKLGILDRYIMAEFYLLLWKEEQCK